MFKRFAAILLCLACVLGTPIFASAAEVQANPTTSGVALNGNNIYCAAYNIGDNNYFRLRDILKALDIGVSYDSAADMISIYTSKRYTPDGSESTSTVSAPATATATKSKVMLNGVPADWTAYNIGGSNYFKLRDILKALDIYVYYSAEFDIIYISTSRSYEDEKPTAEKETAAPAQPTAEVIADSSGRVSPTPITKKALDGGSVSREDFSQKSSFDFDDKIYTRAIYNAIRQSIVDRDIILSCADEKGFNPYYNYAHVTSTAESRYTVVPHLTSFSGYSNYVSSAEPYLEKYYLYPDYLIFTPQIIPLNDEAERNVATLIEQVGRLTSDTDKVKFLNNALCDRMDYDINSSTAINRIFSSTTKDKGECSSFALAFSYLCDRAGIPCIIVSGENHAWNAVYVDGKWLHVDVSINTSAPDRATLLLSPTSRKTDEHPKATTFLKELLVPGSSK